MLIEGVAGSVFKEVQGKPAQNNPVAGPNFMENLSKVACSANMQVAGGNNAASLQLSLNKEEQLDEHFSFTAAEKEIAEEYISRIEKLLKEFNS